MQRQIPEGLRVKYTHLRMTDARPFPVKITEEFAERAGRYRILPNGGETVAVLKDTAGGILASGLAKCNPCDNYSKTAGRKIALGRALAELDGTLAQRRMRDAEEGA